MPKAKQLTVTCENRPGTLADIAKALGDAKVNILSCLATTSGTEGSVKLVVDNVNKAKKALDGAGLSYTEADVLQVELPKPLGERYTAKLAKFDGNFYPGRRPRPHHAFRQTARCSDGGTHK